MNKEQLWLELGPMNGAPPKRLIIGFHSQGSSPESFLPIGLHWQLKLPSAAAALMYEPKLALDGQPGWLDLPALSDPTAVNKACAEMMLRIASAQTAFSIDSAQTLIVGHGIGATIALECLRKDPTLASIIVTYGAKLASPIRPQERFKATIHLIHGEADSIVPTIYADKCYRGLVACAADVSLDIVIDSSHRIDQEMINVSTARVMQTLFRGRRRKSDPNPDLPLH
jgi:phospholipase/carboxylesterase